MTRLGADQALSRAEVVKLALYAAGGQRVDQDDIDAVVGDAAEIALENFVYAGSGGDPGAALPSCNASPPPAPTGPRRCPRLAGTSPSCIAWRRRWPRAAARTRPSQSLRPRPHFKREPVFLAHRKRWGARRLAACLAADPGGDQAHRAARPSLEAAFAERLVLTLSRGFDAGARRCHACPAQIDSAAIEPARATRSELRSKLFTLLKERAFRRGRFTLASGKESDHYFDMKPAMLDPDGAAFSPS